MTSIEESLKTLFGSFLVFGGVLCMWCCIYRYAESRGNRERHNLLRNSENIPRVYTSETVRSHQSGLIVVPS